MTLFSSLKALIFPAMPKLGGPAARPTPVSGDFAALLTLAEDAPGAPLPAAQPMPLGVFAPMSPDAPQTGMEAATLPMIALGADDNDSAAEGPASNPAMPTPVGIPLPSSALDGGSSLPADPAVSDTHVEPDVPTPLPPIPATPVDVEQYATAPVQQADTPIVETQAAPATIAMAPPSLTAEDAILADPAAAPPKPVQTPAQPDALSASATSDEPTWIAQPKLASGATDPPSVSDAVNQADDRHGRDAQPATPILLNPFAPAPLPVEIPVPATSEDADNGIAPSARHGAMVVAAALPMGSATPVPALPQRVGQMHAADRRATEATPESVMPPPAGISLPSAASENSAPPAALAPSNNALRPPMPDVAPRSLTPSMPALPDATSVAVPVPSIPVDWSTLTEPSATIAKAIPASSDAATAAPSANDAVALDARSAPVSRAATPIPPIGSERPAAPTEPSSVPAMAQVSHGVPARTEAALVPADGGAPVVTATPVQRASSPEPDAPQAAETESPTPAIPITAQPVPADKLAAKSEAIALLQIVRDYTAARGASAKTERAQIASATRRTPPPIAEQRSDGENIRPPAPVAPTFPATTAPAIDAARPVDVAAAISNATVDASASGQWIDTLAQDIARLASAGERGHFRIVAGQLGPVEIDIRPHGDGAAISLTVATEAAEMALRDEGEALRKEPALAALRISEVRVERIAPPPEGARADGDSQQRGGASAQQPQTQAGMGQSASQQQQQQRGPGQENLASPHKGATDPAVLRRARADDAPYAGPRSGAVGERYA